MPNRGAIHTQSYYLPGNQEYTHSLLRSGVAPAEIVDSLVVHDALGEATRRQYAIVSLESMPRSAAFTGTNCTDWADHRTGPNYAIAGNILLSAQIVDTMEWAFLNTPGPLAAKLMAALEAAKIAGADTRCAQYGKSSLSAFLRVARSDDVPDHFYCDLYVPNTTDNADPIDLLHEQYDEWLNR